MGLLSVDSPLHLEEVGLHQAYPGGEGWKVSEEKVRGYNGFRTNP